MYCEQLNLNMMLNVMINHKTHVKFKYIVTVPSGPHSKCGHANMEALGKGSGGVSLSRLRRQAVGRGTPLFIIPGTLNPDV